MPIDSSIAMNVQPIQLPDFASLAVKRASVMNSMSEMAARQRAENQKNAFAALLQTPGFDPLGNPEHRMKALSASPDVAPGLIEKMAQTVKIQQEQEAAARAEQAKRRDAAAQRVLQFDNVEDVIADVYSSMNSGVLPKEDADRIVMSLPKDNAGMREWQIGQMRGFFRASDPAKAVEEKTQNVSAGDRIVQQSWRPGVEDAPTGDIAIRMSPAEAAAADVARQNANKLHFTPADDAGMIFGLDPQSGKTVSSTQTTER
jgi:hypothetical protein